VTTRERRLSVFLLAFIVLAGFGFFGYQFVVSPLQAKKAQIAQVQDEIDQRDARIARIRKRKPDLDRWKKLSLPADAADPNKPPEPAVTRPGTEPVVRADLAQREYEDQLNKMLRASGFAAGDITIIPKKPDAKNVPQLANKKPIFTRLLFTVQLKGDLASLVDWMTRYYKVRLLHQVRNLSITTPIGGASRGATPTDLDITMTIEALVLDTAEQRKTLLPDKPVDVPPLLARKDEQYAMIAGKNVFFGPPPPERRDTGPSFDVSPYVRLNGITSGPNGLEATLWDGYHNRDYRISPKSIGGYRVEVMFTLGGRKRTDSDRGGATLTIRDADGAVLDEWTVVRIDPREVILRDDESHYALHIGQSLADLKALGKDELAARGIKPEAAKQSPKKSAQDEP
jgi:hypothetical protein